MQVIHAAPEQGLSKLWERIQTAPHLVELDGKEFTIIRAKSLNELDCGNASGAAEYFLQILSFLEQVWIDAYK